MTILASVIVPCSGPLVATRRCLAALARYTRRFELIALADGSRDRLGDYLAGVADVAPFPVKILSHAPVAPLRAVLNQALSGAQGEYVVLLDHEAIVPDGWLDQLIALAVSNPAIGLCGPMSNAARSPQRVERGSYTNVAGLDHYAAQWRAQHRGQWFTTTTLSGPCVLIRHSLLKSLGGEFTTIDALIKRAQAAGVTLAVAHDVFVHQGFLDFSLSPAATRIIRLEPTEFAERFGTPDTSEALLGYTVRHDADVVLTLVAHAQPLRLLEVGTAFGHMTANLTRWSPAEARVVSLGIVRGMDPGGAPEQGGEAPTAAEFGCFADHFGQGAKATLLQADSRAFDFASLAPLDFAFIDGGHDFELATNDTEKAYAALAPGGWLVWHDFDSKLPWIQVRAAIEALALPEMVYHVMGTEVAFLRKAGPGPDPLVLAPQSAEPLRLIWEGDWRGRHSLGLINRALCLALIEQGHDLALDPGGQAPTADDEQLPLDSHFEARAGRTPQDGRVQVHVTHRWPPRLEPPRQGQWVFFQPWEFGSLPRAWLPALQQVDEVWAYSQAVRDCYLEAGVPPERIHIVPLGVDPAIFRPGLEPALLEPGPDLRFLFVGGTIWRKGIDLVLKAFAQAFTPTDGIGLVIQDMGVKSFYRGQTAGAAIATLQAQGYPVEYREQSLGAQDLAALYTACDAVVQPYRGEGFALPVAEAMACGLPVIVTGAGPVLDYAGAGTAYLVPARRSELPENRVGTIETIARPWVWEPDVDALVDQLRNVARDRVRAKAIGAAASAWIRGKFTWAHAAEAAEVRLRALATTPKRPKEAP
jgi:glycosyltransferase involved in cell wall biosynthesis